MVSEATRNSLRGRKFQKFSGESMPPDPLVWVQGCAREFPHATKNHLNNPCYVYYACRAATQPIDLTSQDSVRNAYTPHTKRDRKVVIYIVHTIMILVGLGGVQSHIDVRSVQTDSYLKCMLKLCI